MGYEYDRSAGVYRTHYDFESGPSLSTTVALLLREITGADASELSPLFTAVDPEGLDELFRPVGTTRREWGYVRFRIDCNEVTIFADGRVEIRPLDA